jgi:uncharacterized membrane protein YebE (DUF533 family)
MTLPANLEPALRDPRKLRRTAWILVGIMIAGGSLVYTAYEKWAASKFGPATVPAAKPHAVSISVPIRPACK